MSLRKVVSVAAIACAVALILGRSAALAQKPPGSGTAPAPALQVVDSGGRVVGTLVDPNSVARLVGTVRVGISVMRQGIVASGYQVYYASTDCSGPSLIYGGDTLRQAGFFTTNSGTPLATTGVYAANPLQRVTVQSAAYVNPNGTVDGSMCSPAGPFTDYFGFPAMFDVATFTPPFEVQ
jgi:hypothetical protein